MYCTWTSASEEPFQVSILPNLGETQTNKAMIHNSPVEPSQQARDRTTSESVTFSEAYSTYRHDMPNRSSNSHNVNEGSVDNISQTCCSVVRRYPDHTLSLHFIHPSSALDQTRYRVPLESLCRVLVKILHKTLSTERQLMDLTLSLFTLQCLLRSSRSWTMTLWSREVQSESRPESRDDSEKHGSTALTVFNAETLHISALTALILLLVEPMGAVVSVLRSGLHLKRLAMSRPEQQHEDSSLATTTPQQSTITPPLSSTPATSDSVSTIRSNLPQMMPVIVERDEMASSTEELPGKVSAEAVETSNSLQLSSTSKSTTSSIVEQRTTSESLNQESAVGASIGEMSGAIEPVLPDIPISPANHPQDRRTDTLPKTSHDKPVEQASSSCDNSPVTDIDGSPTLAMTSEDSVASTQIEDEEEGDEWDDSLFDENGRRKRTHERKWRDDYPMLQPPRRHSSQSPFATSPFAASSYSSNYTFLPLTQSQSDPTPHASKSAASSSRRPFPSLHIPSSLKKPSTVTSTSPISPTSRSSSRSKISLFIQRHFNDSNDSVSADNRHHGLGIVSRAPSTSSRRSKNSNNSTSTIGPEGGHLSRRQRLKRFLPGTSRFSRSKETLEMTPATSPVGSSSSVSSPSIASPETFAPMSKRKAAFAFARSSGRRTMMRRHDSEDFATATMCTVSTGWRFNPDTTGVNEAPDLA